MAAPTRLDQGQYFRTIVRAVPSASVIPGRSVDEHFVSEFTREQIEAMDPVGLGLKVNHTTQTHPTTGKPVNIFFGRVVDKMQTTAGGMNLVVEIRPEKHPDTTRGRAMMRLKNELIKNIEAGYFPDVSLTDLPLAPTYDGDLMHQSRLITELSIVAEGRRTGSSIISSHWADAPYLGDRFPDESDFPIVLAHSTVLFEGGQGPPLTPQSDLPGGAGPPLTPQPDISEGRDGNEGNEVELCTFVREYLARERARMEAALREEGGIGGAEPPLEPPLVKKDIRSHEVIEQNVTTHDEQKIEMSTTVPPQLNATALAATVAATTAPAKTSEPLAKKDLAPAVSDDLTALVWGRQRDAEEIAKLKEENKKLAEAEAKAAAEAKRAAEYEPIVNQYKRLVQESDDKNVKRLRADWDDSVRRTKERFVGIDDEEAKPHLAIIDEADKSFATKFDEHQKRVSCGEEARDKMEEFSKQMQTFTYLLNANNVAGELAARKNEALKAQHLRARADELTAQGAKSQPAAAVPAGGAHEKTALYIPTLLVSGKEAYAQELERKRAELKAQGDKVQELLKGTLSPADALKTQQK